MANSSELLTVSTVCLHLFPAWVFFIAECRPRFTGWNILLWFAAT